MIHQLDYLRVTELRAHVCRRVTFFQFLAWWAKPIVITSAVVIAAAAFGLALARYGR